MGGVFCLRLSGSNLRVKCINETVYYSVWISVFYSLWPVHKVYRGCHGFGAARN